MDRAYQIDRQVPFAFGRTIADDGGFQSDWLLLLVPLQANELSRLGFLNP